MINIYASVLKLLGVKGIIISLLVLVLCIFAGVEELRISRLENKLKSSDLQAKYNLSSLENCLHKKADLEGILKEQSVKIIKESKRLEEAKALAEAEIYDITHKYGEQKAAAIAADNSGEAKLRLIKEAYDAFWGAE